MGSGTGLHTPGKSSDGMHELVLTQSIVDLVGNHASGQKEQRVTLEIGKCSGVMTDALRFCFDIAAQGTALEGAALEIREIEVRALCAVCGKEFVQKTLYMP